MTTINERLKDIRKSRKLTLAEFGQAIGYKPSTISQIERGIAPYDGRADDRYILAVSRTYGVSELWIRTGEGEINANVPPADASAMRAQLVVSMYRELSPASQALIIELAKALIAEEESGKKIAEDSDRSASEGSGRDPLPRRKSA